MLCHGPIKANCNAIIRGQIVTHPNSNEPSCSLSDTVNAIESTCACYTSVLVSCVASIL